MVEFKGWLAKGDYRVVDISNSSGLTLHVPNRSSLVESFSYDVARFVWAASESARGLGVDADFPKATAWAAIRLYYSAFFAAHAILRYFGVSCSQIDHDQSLKVNDFASSIYGIGNRMQSGFYSAKFISASSDVVMAKYSDSHKDTWKCFKEVLGDVCRLVMSGDGITAEKLTISQLIEDLSRAISVEGASAGNWLSQYRNAVNYRQAYDAWYPYKKTSVDFGSISKYTDGWRGGLNYSSALGESDKRIRFFGVCSVILMIMRILAADLVKNSPRCSIHATRTARIIE